MADDPKPPARPIIILGGYMDPGFNRARMDQQLNKVLADGQLLGVAFPFVNTFEGCRDRVIERVQERFPSDDPDWTAEVDVVAYSMGGLIARYSALPVGEDERPRRRLKIARLFTIATPHRGAAMSALPHYDPVVRDMRADSEFLRALDDALPAAGYPLYAYVRLGDNVVGPENAAPPGMTPWWVSAQPFSGSHMHAHRDPRIVADIARRLRGEPPLAADPPAPLPK